MLEVHLNSSQNILLALQQDHHPIIAIHHSMITRRLHFFITMHHHPIIIIQSFGKPVARSQQGDEHGSKSCREAGNCSHQSCIYNLSSFFASYIYQEFFKPYEEKMVFCVQSKTLERALQSRTQCTDSPAS